MCVKLLSRDLNSGPYSSHPTSSYTYKMTIAPRMYGGPKILKNYHSSHLENGLYILHNCCGRN